MFTVVHTVTPNTTRTDFVHLKKAGGVFNGLKTAMIKTEHHSLLGITLEPTFLSPLYYEELKRYKVYSLLQVEE